MRPSCLPPPESPHRLSDVVQPVHTHVRFLGFLWLLPVNCIMIFPVALGQQPLVLGQANQLPPEPTFASQTEAECDKLIAHLPDPVRLALQRIRPLQHLMELNVQIGEACQLACLVLYRYP